MLCFYSLWHIVIYNERKGTSTNGNIMETSIGMRYVLGAILLIGLTSCSSQEEQVTINQNGSNLSQKAAAISMVIIEPEVKIGTFMVYRPHRLFSIPANNLKPLPRSMHSHPGVMLLLNGGGYEKDV